MSVFTKFAEFYDLIYEDKPYKKEADMVYKWANRPGFILDLGCGTGQHAKHWVDRAFIHGVDKSKTMLKKAYKNYRITYQNGDIVKCNFEYGLYDAVFAMFNVVGYLDYYQFEKLLGNVPLEKGGYFIFDCWDYDKIYPKSKTRVVTRDKITRISFLHHSATVFFYIYDKKHKLLCNEAHEITSYSAHLIKSIAKTKGYKVAGSKDTDGWVRWWRLKKL